VNPTASVTAGNHGVGAIGVNPADIRGEGRSDEPVIVKSISIHLNAQPKDR
jgi:hypothetical protein